MSKQVFPINTLVQFGQFEQKEENVILLDAIEINLDHSIVLCYWPWKQEYVTWDQYGIGNMNSGHYFSNKMSFQTNGRSGLQAGVDDLYRRAKNAGWKPDKKVIVSR